MILSKLRPEHLSEWRLTQGWSRVVLAERLGLSTSAIDKYEDGTRAIPLIVALALAALEHKIRALGDNGTGEPETGDA